VAAEAHLPEWVAVLQALLVPVIAAVGTWIALQQMHLSRVRLQATQRLLDAVIMDRKISTDVFVTFATSVGAARFIFDDRLARYLREVLDHASRLYSIQMVLQGMPAGEKREKASVDEGLEFKWLIDQKGGLGEKFQAILQLEPRWTFPGRRGLSR
jgi:hypothetical protein